MKISKIIIILILISFTFPLFAAPESSGKLAGTETAFIDNNVLNLGLMDSTYDFSEIISIKTNILFDIIGLYNIGVKAGYHFKNIMNLRAAVGYTGFYLNEAQMLTAVVNNSTEESGITINSLDLGIEGQKIYIALMLPVGGFNINTNFGIYQSKNTDSFSKVTLGLEKTFLNNNLAIFANGGIYFNLPESNTSAATEEVLYNNLVSDLYADGGLRYYISDHFNLEIGFIYPGMIVPLGTDPDTGEEMELNLPALPVFNIAYRF